MSYAANIEGFEGQNIEVKMSFWTGAKLFVNGVIAPKGSRRGEMLLNRNDGTQAVATWKQQALGLDVPQLVVDGKTITVVEPLKWYQMLWSALPIALIIIGGFLGALTGIIAFTVNSKVFRSSMNGFLKYLLTAVITGAAVVLYFILAFLVHALLNG